jgi:hypothetical protein
MSTNDTLFKPSLSIQNQIPKLDDSSFQTMIAGYYEWMQTSKLEFYQTAGTVEAGGTSGTFKNGEYVVGTTTKARALIKVVGTSYFIIKMITETPFNLREKFTGETSGATAYVFSIKDNVVRASGQYLNSKTPEKSSGAYFDYLTDELNKGIPKITSADRRGIVNKFKDFYRSKSNEEAYQFIFAALYNDKTIELRYPGKEVLKISDGKYYKPTVIRVITTSDILDLLNKTIVGVTSGALALVTDITSTFIQDLGYSELTLTLTQGKFLASEGIKILGNSKVYTTTYGILVGVNINDPGTGYSVGDNLPVVGTGYDAKVTVSEIGSGSVNRVKLNSTGYGYRVGSLLTVDSANSGGSGLIVSVKSIANTYTLNGYTVGEVTAIQVLNTGYEYTSIPPIVLEDTTIKSIGALSERLITLKDRGSDYSVGNTLIFTGGSGANAVGIIASVGNIDNIVTEIEDYLTTEDGFYIINERNITDDTDYGFDNILLEGKRGAVYNLIQEETLNGKASAIKHEDWLNIGPISRIELTNSGDGYTIDSLPTITANSTTGYNAEFTCTGIQGFGGNASVDYANNVSGLGSIRGVDIIQGLNYSSSNTTINATTLGAGNANLTPIIIGTNISKGVYLNNDSKLSDKKIQDSYFYQDFSYVIRSSEFFSDYSDLIKDILHPAGMEFFGEIVLLSFILNIFNNNTVNAEIVKQLPSSLLYAVANTETANTNLREPEFYQGYLNGKFDDLKIFDLWYVESEAYTGNTFNDSWHTWDGPHVTKLIKSPGTVTITTNMVGNTIISCNVVGTGTAFVGDYFDGEELIVGIESADESANILNVANNTFMTLNLIRPLAGTYTDAPIYKRRLQ